MILCSFLYELFLLLLIFFFFDSSQNQVQDRSSRSFPIKGLLQCNWQVDNIKKYTKGCKVLELAGKYWKFCTFWCSVINLIFLRFQEYLKVNITFWTFTCRTEINTHQFGCITRNRKAKKLFWFYVINPKHFFLFVFIYFFQIKMPKL